MVDNSRGICLKCSDIGRNLNKLPEAGYGKERKRMSGLTDKLAADRKAIEEEISALQERRERLLCKLEYIEELIASTSTARFNDKTIAEVALSVLEEEGKPLAAIEIAKKAMAGGWKAENIERARSHFSAVISRDLGSTKPRFWQAGRGAIGLAEWKPSQRAGPTFAEEQPFESAPLEDAPFKDDEIPF